jgi:hypothetical protein
MLKINKKDKNIIEFYLFHVHNLVLEKMKDIMKYNIFLCYKLDNRDAKIINSLLYM